MNSSNLTNSQISERVKQALKMKEMSVRRCCELFNASGFSEFHDHKKMVIDKDFVQRIKQNKFSVVSLRVSKLCEFLEIDLKAGTPSKTHGMSEQFHLLEKVIEKNPELEITLKALLANVVEAITLNRV